MPRRKSNLGRLEDERLRARSYSAASDLLCSKQNERDRVRVAGRQQPRNYNRLAFRYNPADDYSLSLRVPIGTMTEICPYYKALKFNEEMKGMCCAAGKIKLPQLEEPPEPLKTLPAGYTAELKCYPTCFQMTSIVAEIVTTQFMPTFKVKRQIYHKAGSLLPLADVCLFKTAIDMMPSDSYKIGVHAGKTPAGEHVRRFNAPTIDEVAVVIVGDQFQLRDIFRHRRNGELTKFAETHRCYDAL
ncbi:unnamed protein product [Onchocerca ochengi]|uniref:DUF663 domain-containing protein n=1 Tax=Onchocerca ochengi TaxID=42157 RepID=A0A182E1U2_ONCOC|nr:unnamed protein product [Onchocerca ochengi]